MSQLKMPKKPVPDWEQVRDEWVRAVEQLVADVEAWCEANGWPTRRIEKRLDDSQIGEYAAPAVLIQVDLVKLLLEPVARFVPGGNGLIDLYRMPQYDDVASIYWRGSQWHVHYPVLKQNTMKPREGDPPFVEDDKVEMFTREVFTAVVGQMIHYG